MSFWGKNENFRLNLNTLCLYGYACKLFMGLNEVGRQNQSFSDYLHFRCFFFIYRVFELVHWYLNIDYWCTSLIFQFWFLMHNWKLIKIYLHFFFFWEIFQNEKELVVFQRNHFFFRLKCKFVLTCNEWIWAIYGAKLFGTSEWMTFRLSQFPLFFYMCGDFF